MPSNLGFMVFLTDISLAILTYCSIQTKTASVCVHLIAFYAYHSSRKTPYLTES